jgi:hypothetical protein
MLLLNVTACHTHIGYNTVLLWEQGAQLEYEVEEECWCHGRWPHQQ